MKWNRGSPGGGRGVIFWLAVACGLLAGGCGQAATVVPTAAATGTSWSATETGTFTSTPSATRTPRPTASPTLTASPQPLPSSTVTNTPFSRKLEDYGLAFDENASPRIPFRRSVSMPIWDEVIPAAPVTGTPRLVVHPVPPGLGPAGPELLAQAGCASGSWGIIECAADSPLAGFGCDEMIIPEEVFFPTGTEPSLVAACWQRTEDWEPVEGDSLYLVGCAFRRKVRWIFKIGDSYVLADDQSALQGLFAPIESSAEAVGYAQLATGLRAVFDLSPNPYLLYLQETIESTHLLEEKDGFTLNLYHQPGCFCEPYVYSLVTVHVSRDGTITLGDVVPYALTTGFSCAD